mgnify:CR=1 FL=1
MEKLLEVENLSVSYFTYAGESCTIDNARLSVAKGREADVRFAEVDIDIAEIPLAGDLRVEAVGHDHLHACLAWHI